VICSEVQIIEDIAELLLKVDIANLDSVVNAVLRVIESSPQSLKDMVTASRDALQKSRDPNQLTNSWFNAIKI
jgi:hypothetical protein